MLTQPQPPRFSRKMIGAAAIVALALVAAWYLLQSGIRNQPKQGQHADGSRIEPETARAPEPQRGSVPEAQPGAKPETGRDARRVAWNEFRARFGESLEAQFLPSGELAWARAKSLVGGKRADHAFRPEDPRKAISRAREVIDFARDLIGTESQAPLENPVYKGDTVSAQVVFRQSIGGIPIAPRGSVTVDLGTQGELIAIYSDYVKGVRVVNEPKLPMEDARSRAISAAPDHESAIRPEGGSRVVWVSRAGAMGTAEGRHAYEFNVQGRQVIVDAESGTVLFQRDRRRY